MKSLLPTEDPKQSAIDQADNASWLKTSQTWTPPKLVKLVKHFPHLSSRTHHYVYEQKEPYIYDLVVACCFKAVQ
uniref:Uncharacterized protein n=1 Tax=Rhizophora mucronata TaxID=61149 RepID=A0A2P2Q337_RHIMU